jgi:hypothetical protein
MTAPMLLIPENAFVPMPGTLMKLAKNDGQLPVHRCDLLTTSELSREASKLV